jgi:hypothetical protein
MKITLIYSELDTPEDTHPITYNDALYVAGDWVVDVNTWMNSFLASGPVIVHSIEIGD